MILQPLVENAVRHGIARAPRAGSSRSARAARATAAPARGGRRPRLAAEPGPTAPATGWGCRTRARGSDTSTATRTLRVGGARRRRRRRLAVSLLIPFMEGGAAEGGDEDSDARSSTTSRWRASASAATSRPTPTSRSSASAPAGARPWRPSAACGPTSSSSTCRCPSATASRCSRRSGADAVPAVVFVTAYDQLRAARLRGRTRSTTCSSPSTPSASHQAVGRASVELRAGHSEATDERLRSCSGR